jgi:hypothetical protein
MPLTANLTLNGLLTVAPLAGSTNETDCWANAVALMASKPAANTDFIMMTLLLRLRRHSGLRRNDGSFRFRINRF